MSRPDLPATGQRGLLHRVLRAETLPDRLLLWGAVLLVSLVFFYGLNHLVMGLQGLPLAWDLTPASS